MLIGRLHQLRGWKRLAVAFLAGGLSVLAHAPFHLWPILFLTLPVLVWLIDAIAPDNRPNRKTLFWQAARTGWAFGFGYFLFGLYWIGKAFLVEAGIYIVLMPVAMTLMPAGLALFYALAVGLASLFWRPGLSRILMLSVTFAGTEWLRGHILTGFPWNAFGHVFAGEAGLSQLSSLFGPYALSFFCIALFAAPAIALSPRSDTREADSLNFTTLKPSIMSLLPWPVMTGISSEGHHPPVGITAPVQNRSTTFICAWCSPILPKPVDKWRTGNAGPDIPHNAQTGRAGLQHTISGQRPGSRSPTLYGQKPPCLFSWPAQKKLLLGIDKLLARQHHPHHRCHALQGLEHQTTNGQRSSQRAHKHRVQQPLSCLMTKRALLPQHSTRKHLVPFGEYLPWRSAPQSDWPAKNRANTRSLLKRGQNPATDQTGSKMRRPLRR